MYGLSGTNAQQYVFSRVIISQDTTRVLDLSMMYVSVYMESAHTAISSSCEMDFRANYIHITTLQWVLCKAYVPAAPTM